MITTFMISCYLFTNTFVLSGLCKLSLLVFVCEDTQLPKFTIDSLVTPS